MSEVAKIVDKQSPLRQAGQVQAQTQEQEPRKCGQKAYSKMTAEELAIAKAKRGTYETDIDQHYQTAYSCFLIIFLLFSDSARITNRVVLTYIGMG